MMFLRDQTTNGLIEVLDVQKLFDPFATTVRGRTQAGEDTMDEVECEKTTLVFPSGESLPKCWCDAHYRESTH